MSDAREGRPDYVACFIRKNTALAIILLFTSGATVGWIGRGFRDNDWRIGPEPVRWHPATLVDVVDGDTIKVKWDSRASRRCGLSARGDGMTPILRAHPK